MAYSRFRYHTDCYFSLHIHIMTPNIYVVNVTWPYHIFCPWLRHVIRSWCILGRELGPSGLSTNQRSRWKHDFSPLNMFNLRLCDAATIQYSQLKFGHMHVCGMYFSPQCCKCNSFVCIAAIKCGNACRGPHSDSLYPGSEHSQFNSPRLVKREAGFPNQRWALIGSNQLWRVNDSPYCRE